MALTRFTCADSIELEWSDMRQADRLALFPNGASVNSRGHLEFGGCDVIDLAIAHGTPLYVFDEQTLRAKIGEFRLEFGTRYPSVSILYACKAFTNKAVLQLMAEELVGLDVVSGGEIEIAMAADFPMSTVSFPGNNKSRQELGLALDVGVGRIVVDNFDELEMLRSLARARSVKPRILLRINPGVDPHAHKYEATGSVDSKFGFPMPLAAEAVARAVAAPELIVEGLHFHVGSQLQDAESHERAIATVLDFAYGASKRDGFVLSELSVGGGYPVQHTMDAPVPALGLFAETITSAVKDKCAFLGIDLPRLVVEPGRSLVAQAGVALYTVGTKKVVPGIRKYVAVDGGMADNIRPELYQSKMEAVIANRMNDEAEGVYTVAGKFCESGDILIWDIQLPEPHSGDVLATAGCGAYNIPQSCNYNAFTRPAVVMVRLGKARVIRRRETIADLMACDV